MSTKPRTAGILCIVLVSLFASASPALAQTVEPDEGGAGQPAAAGDASAAPDHASEPTDVADAPADVDVALHDFEHDEPSVSLEAEHTRVQITRSSGRALSTRLLHGFRLGYSYLANGHRPDPSDPSKTVLEKLRLRSASNFVLGYELFYRLVGHSWLNVLLVGNLMIAGLEQSRFLPSGNFLIGFEFDREIQLGVGINLTPDRSKTSHMISALGWTPLVGSFYVPVHLFFIPDVDRNHRMGATIGVTW